MCGGKGLFFRFLHKPIQCKSSVLSIQNVSPQHCRVGLSGHMWPILIVSLMYQVTDYLKIYKLIIILSSIYMILLSVQKNIHQVKCRTGKLFLLAKLYIFFNQYNTFTKLTISSIQTPTLKQRTKYRYPNNGSQSFTIKHTYHVESC